jgi:hypothetical protein
MLPSSGEGVGDAHSVGSTRKTTDSATLCAYMYVIILYVKLYTKMGHYVKDCVYLLPPTKNINVDGMCPSRSYKRRQESDDRTE